jgi:hypothetical protein
MSSRGALGTGATGCTPPTALRATRSNTKVTTQQTNVSPQTATIEKNQVKAKEAEAEACKILIGEECLKDETDITHQLLLNALTSLIQKYSNTAPESLTRALMALATLMLWVNSSNMQLEPVINSQAQKLGERIETSMKAELDKVSMSIKSSLTEHCKSISPPESLTETITTLNVTSL